MTSILKYTLPVAAALLLVGCRSATPTEPHGTAKAEKTESTLERKVELVRDGKSKRALSLTFSPDGKTLAAGGDDATITLWDLATGKTARTLKDDDFIVGCALIRELLISRDGKALVSGCDKIVRVWDLGLGKRTFVQSHFDIHCLAWVKEHETLLLGCDNKCVVVDLKTGTHFDPLMMIKTV